MTEKSKKILLFSTAYFPYIGGAEIALKEITARLNDFSFDLITAYLDPNLSKEEQLENVMVFRVGGFFLASKFLSKLLLPILGFFKARKLIKTNDYLCIFSLQASYGGGAAFFTKLFYKSLPLIVNLQEGEDLTNQGFLKSVSRKLIVRSADYITVISEHLKRVVLDFGVSEKKVKVIPNGVTLENFDREFSYGELSDVRDSLGINPGVKMIVSTSRLVNKNGLDVLIKAGKVLAETHNLSDFKIVLIGEGLENSSLKELAHSLDIGNKVIFAGTVSPNFVPKYLKAADVFVRPSRTEGLGNSFLESMAARTPVVGTFVGGIKDFLKDPLQDEAPTGLVCEVDNPASVAEKVKLILENKNLRNKLTSNAFKTVKERYDWNKIASSYKFIFESIK